MDVNIIKYSYKIIIKYFGDFFSILFPVKTELQTRQNILARMTIHAPPYT